MTKRSLLIAIGIVLVAGPVLFPWSSSVAPAVRVRVFDELGQPAKQSVVKQEWVYLAPGMDRWYREHSRTDEHGYAVFPERKVRVSIAQKVVGFLRELVSLPHG
jgi:hypothetical protein